MKFAAFLNSARCVPPMRYKNGTYKEMGEILARILEDFFDMQSLFLHGGLARQKRDDMMEKLRFMEEPGG